MRIWQGGGVAVPRSRAAKGVASTKVPRLGSGSARAGSPGTGGRRSLQAARAPVLAVAVLALAIAAVAAAPMHGEPVARILPASEAPSIQPEAWPQPSLLLPAAYADHNGPCSIGANSASDPTVRISFTRPDGTPMQNRTYGLGETINIRVEGRDHFDTTGTEDGRLPLTSVELETGDINRFAYHHSHGNGGAGTWPGNYIYYNYTVQEEDYSDDLDYNATNSLYWHVWSGGGANGNVFNQAFANYNCELPTPGTAGSLSNQSDISVDGRTSRVLSATFNVDDDTYTEGELISIDVDFDKPVAYNTSAPPTLLLAFDDANRVATDVSGNGTTTLTFNYTVQAGDNVADLDYAGTDALAAGGGVMYTLNNNRANLTLAAPGAMGSLSNQSMISVDARAPIVLNVTSPTPNGTYAAGREIAITVAFDEAVLVSGTPSLELEMDDENGQADYDSGHNTTALTFLYAVQSGDSAADLGYAGRGALTLPGGATIKDAAGNNASRLLPAPDSLSNQSDISVDARAPEVVNVTSPTPDGTYTEGMEIKVSVAFNETVLVSGTPSLELEMDGENRLVDSPHRFCCKRNGAVAVE